MKMKRFTSVLVVLSMLLSLCVPTAFAAGGDYVAGLTVTKVDDAKLSVSCDIGPSGASATIRGVQTFIVAYDTGVLKPLLKNGNAITGITTMPTAKAMAYEVYEDPDTAETWNTNVYVYQSADGKTGFLLIQPAEGNSGSTLTAKVSLAKVYLGFQEGKNYSDVTKQTVRFATSSELAGMSENKAVRIANDGEFSEWTNGGSGDTLTTIPTVEASGFDFAKAPLAGNVSISGTAQIGQKLTATPSITSADPGELTYKWYRGDSTTPISGATGNTYTPSSAEDVGKKIKVEVSAANYSSSVSATTSETVAKKDGPSAPSAPTVTETHNTVTVESPATENEYAINTTNSAPTDGWKNGTTVSFTGLNPGTDYYVFARVKGTGTTKASEASSAATVKTDKAPAGAPVTPVVASKSDTNITVTKVDDQKYMIKKASETAPTAGDSGWADEVEFTGLTPNTAYKIYTYIPESSTTAASAVASTDVTTDKTSIAETMVSVSNLSKTYTAEAQEPTFGGTLTSGTDYTVTYALKEAGKGELKDNKPCGAGTYVVTVSGAGSYGSSFTKDFTIDKKEVTITPNASQSKTYGAAEPELTYSTDLTAGSALETAFNTVKSGALARDNGTDVGTYAIKLGTLAAGSNFSLTLASGTVNFTITAKNVTESRAAVSQTIVKGVGDFTPPTFGDVTGTLTYTYDGITKTYDEIKTALASKNAGTTGTISYTYTANGNYAGTITGSINFTVVNVTFDVQADAISVATNPTYGSKWSQIVSFDASKITAKVGSNTCVAPTYTLKDADTVPNSGSQTYTITFSGTINGVNYTDVTVKSDSVSIGKATVTVAAGDYKVSKVYDGTTSAGTVSGALAVSGILPTDSGVTVTPTIGAYSNANVGTGNVNVSLSISGDTNNNYQLGAVSVSVPCEITQATLTVDGTASATADYGTALKDIPITGLTAKLNGSNVAGSWAFSGETILDAGNTTAYTATFTPSTGVDNYNTLTSSIVPTINKIAYTGSAITATKNVLTNTAVNGVEVDMTSLLTSIKGAAVSAASENSDADNIISNVSKDGNKVKFDVASIAAKDKNATINVTISSTNYTDIAATITVTTVDKAEASVSISGAPTSKTYGDADFNLTASATNPGTGTGVWTWTSSEPTVLQVTGSSAAATVKVLKAGSATITAKYESDTTMGEQTTAPITVSKRVITVTADNKSMTVNGTLPTFTVTYGNLPSGVQAADIFGTLASASTTTDGKTTGSFDITVTTPVLKTEAGANYEVGAVTKGTLTVNPRSSSGGGGGSYTPSYSITVDKTENGTITVSPKSASKGDTVTITVKPDKGYELDTLKVLDKDGDKVKLTEKNGKYTFKMPSGKVTVKGSFVEEAPVQIFKDVPVDAYYYEAVKWAAEKGITGGVGNGLFAPNQPCTRAQIVTFLWRAAGSPDPKNMSSFADVPADAFYAKAVAWAVENGITGGTGDGKFSPDATCTRAQSVTFLYRAAGSPKVSSSAEFGDVATNAYYADAVAWAAKNGITGGIGGGLFGSDNNCTRAQIVTFLYRSVK